MWPLSKANMVNRITPGDDPVIWITREDLKTTITKMIKGLQKKGRCNIKDMRYSKKQMETLKKK